MKGTINPGTGDWMLTRNRIWVVDARVVLKTDDDAIVHMNYGGRITFPSEVESAMLDSSRRHMLSHDNYYFRTMITFETGAKPYSWMNEIIAIGLGRLIEGGVAYDVFAID